MSARAPFDLRLPPLGDAGLVLLIAFVNMFVCMSLDMYLPAVPSMVQNLHSSPDMVNLTMALFYAFLAVGTIVVGPLSEKYGRRTPLLVCIVLYLSASLGCACSDTVFTLIVFRIGEALGGGGMVSISTALVKDCFEPERRGKVLAVTNAVSMIGPMAAPVIGSLLLIFFSWRAIFYLLAIMGAVCLFLTLFLQEPLAEDRRFYGTVSDSLLRLFVVAKQGSFTAFLLLSSLLLVPFMGYVAVSSYVYIDYFGLSVQSYGLFFAANTAFSILAPFGYIKLADRWSPKTFLMVVSAGTALTGALLLMIGFASPFLFLASVIPMTVAECLLRPVAIPLLLEQRDGDTGSASSLINSAYTLISSGGMLIGSMHVFGYLHDLALLCLVASIGFNVFFAILGKSRIVVKGLR